jgi:hypothetical protein
MGRGYCAGSATAGSGDNAKHGPLARTADQHQLRPKQQWTFGFNPPSDPFADLRVRCGGGAWMVNVGANPF